MQLGLTELDVEMFHHESWKPVYFEVKGQGHKAQKVCRRGVLHSCECRLLLVNYLITVLTAVLILNSPAPVTSEIKT